MHGNVRQWLVGRPASRSADDFRSAYAGVLASIQASDQLDGGVACAGDDYFVFWGLGAGVADPIEQLAAVGGEESWSQEFTPQPTTLEAGLWDQWPGMTIGAGDSFNMQFKRRWES